MSLRAVIVALIVLATAGFVVGTTLERSSKEPSTESSGARAGESHPEGGERVSHEEAHGEYQPFGVDIEAPAFIVLAALASLALAAAVWLRPHSLPVLAVVAAAMVLFALLDVREIGHQVDESRTGLAVLAGAVAALHLAAAAAIGAQAYSVSAIASTSSRDSIPTRSGWS